MAHMDRRAQRSPARGQGSTRGRNDKGRRSGAASGSQSGQRNANRTAAKTGNRSAAKRSANKSDASRSSAKPAASQSSNRSASASSKRPARHQANSNAARGRRDARPAAAARNSNRKPGASSRAGGAASRAGANSSRAGGAHNRAANSRAGGASSRAASQRGGGRSGRQGVGADEDMDFGSERREAVRQEKVHPAVFIIPAAAILLIGIIFMASGSSHGPRKKSKQQESTYRYRAPKKKPALTAGDKLLAQGQTMLAKAQAMPLSPERNKALKRAGEVFMQASKSFEASGQRNKVAQANQFRYACMKYSTE